MSQWLKSPTRQTTSAFGAQTAKLTRELRGTQLRARPVSYSFVVCPFAVQVQIEIAQYRRKPIRILYVFDGAVPEVEPDSVITGSREHRPRRGHGRGAVHRKHSRFDKNFGRCRLRQKGTNRPALVTISESVRR